ncbi:uncharacterized protein LOC134537755 isoform X3 [Bacillus rossius redtenbacheri]|uniref:uncharacterized protein LOC134537755 isoform X3 n=1 Tax=Bacillus rossius redtenbacheri TaxID=93214 RepID=UPI002FDE71DD
MRCRAIVAVRGSSWREEGRELRVSPGPVAGGAGRPEGAVVSGSGGLVLALGTVNQELHCRADRGLDYCWFRAPDGGHVVPAADRQELAAGLCRHRLGPVGPEHAGRWACCMGVAGRRAGDLVHRISVRVADSTLLAEASEVKVDAGGTAVLSCTTVPAGKTLSYCRFVSPTGRGFSFSEANRNETIMDRYQQSHGPLGQYRGIRVGVCSVTITAVHAEDYGKWRCSGVIQGTFAEGSDFIILSQEESAVNGISMAAIVGAAVGSATVIAVVVAFMWWVVKKKKRSNGHHNLSDSGSEHSSEVQLQMGELPSLASRFAAGTRQVSFRRRRSVHS